MNLQRFLNLFLSCSACFSLQEPNSPVLVKCQILIVAGLHRDGARQIFFPGSRTEIRKETRAH